MLWVIKIVKNFLVYNVNNYFFLLNKQDFRWSTMLYIDYYSIISIVVIIFFTYKRIMHQNNEYYFRPN